MNEVKKIKRGVFSTLTKVHFSTGLKSEFKELTAELSITPESLSRAILSGTVSVLGINIHGLCVRNENGGYEFYNAEYMEEPATLLHPGTTVILQKPEQRTMECYAFLSFLDYLAFQNLQYNNSLPQDVSFSYDSIIIGDESNLIDALLDSDTYTKVHCVFPYNLIGRTVNQTFITRNPNVYTDISGFYQTYNSVYEYNKIINSNITALCQNVKNVLHTTLTRE